MKKETSLVIIEVKIDKKRREKKKRKNMTRKKFATYAEKDLLIMKMTTIKNTTM